MIKNLLIWIALWACMPMALAQNSQIPAFPGAEGFGKYTTGGRGGKVYIVTNLNDSGPGSLREALGAKETRTIVFEVSGTIYLQSSINVRNPNVTIAGQTAPGEGITIANYWVNLARMNNIIVRFIRFRPGDTSGKENQAAYGRLTENVIFDHCTFSWATDEIATFYAVRNFTMQWSIISEALNNSIHSKGPHGYGSITGGKNVSWHHNLIAHAKERMTMFDRDGLYMSAQEIIDWRGITDFRNNVIYNWQDRASSNGARGQFNVVNNYYKKGPAASGDRVDYILNPQSSDTDGKITYGKFFLDGNILEGNQTVNNDNWQGVRLENTDLHNRYIEGVKATIPFFIPNGTYSFSESAQESYLKVLDKAGASLFRDPVDSRVVQEARTGTYTYEGSKGSTGGIIDSQNDVGGWPVLESLPAPKDTDRDGMPDAWETARGLNPNTYNPNGYNLDPNYTNLEVYLNGLVAHIMEPDNTENIAVTGVSVDPKTGTVDAGNTLQLNASVQPNNASNRQVSWSSSNTAIATVNASGLVRGIAPGSAVITAKTSEGGFTAASTITVNPITVPSIASLVLVRTGDNTDFRTLSDGLVLDISEIVGKTWSIRANSSPSTIGSVFLSMSGPLSASKTENTAPYTLFGDSNGIYQGRELSVGRYTVEAIPYTGASRGGTAGASFRIEFEIKELPLAAPILVSPSDQASNQELTGTLQWEAVANASSYRVQISETSNFSNVLVDQGALTSNQFSYTVPKSATRYFWRVLASNGGGNGNWSTVWSFTTKTSVQIPSIPILSSPTKDSTIPVGNSSFFWITVPGAETYRVQVSKESQFSSPTFDVYNLPGTSVTLDIKDSGTYFWRVSAANQAGSSAFSDARGFQTVAPPTPPQLVAPSNQTVDLANSVLLRWSSVTNAASYRVQISTRRDFGQVLRDVANVANTQLQVDNLSGGIVYYWRVRTVNVAGLSEFSEVWEFKTRTPQVAPTTPVLSTPVQNAVLAAGKILFSWQPPADAEAYHLQIAKDPQFSTPITDTKDLPGNSLEIEIKDPGTYYWRVSASNQTGSSAFSAASTFQTVVAPAAPQLLAPANQALDLPNSVLLRWSAVGNAASYRVQVSTGRDFSQVLRDVSDVSNTQLQVDNLAEGITYYWRVRASNVAGSSNFSPIWEFSTKKALSAPAAPILSSPGNASLVPNAALRLLWQSTTGAESYQIQISLNSNFNQQILVNQQGISGTAFEFQDLAFNTVYFWRVRARNAAGFGPYSSIRSFRTAPEPQLDPARLRSPAKGAILESDTVVFAWSPVKDASDYTLYLSEDSLFRSGQSILRSIVDTTLQLVDLEREKTYFWRVEAQGSKKTSISEVWKFSIEKEKEPEVFVFRKIGIDLYPNPARDHINLRFSEFVSGVLQIQFLDSRGVMVFQAEYKEVGNELRLDFTGFGIPSGKYFLRIQGEWFVETKQVWIE